MRILVTSRPGAGHFGPLVPFARALQRAGDDVLVAIPGAAGEMADAAGFAVWPLDDPPQEGRAALFARAHALGDTEAANRLVVGEVFIGMDTPAWLPGVEEAAEAFDPDLILSESAELAGGLVAERRGIPLARVSVSLPGLEARFTETIAAAVAKVRARAGLRLEPGAPSLLDAPALTQIPAAFEDPASPAPAAVHRFREGGTEAAQPLPDWWPGDDRPLVYFTLGSVAAGEGYFPELYREAIGVLGELPARVLVTVGRDCDPAELAPVPANVHVERWVPQADVMPHVAAMVCHGGSGTVRMGLAAGVPMVVLPLFADQPYNAARIAALGAGLALSDGVAGLGDAVRSVLAEPAYASAAARVAAEIRRMPPVAAAVPLLHELARGGVQAAAAA